MIVIELGTKTRSKRELNCLLQSDVNIYLLPSREANTKHLSDFISGIKIVDTNRPN